MREAVFRPASGAASHSALPGAGRYGGPLLRPRAEPRTRGKRSGQHRANTGLCTGPARRNRAQDVRRR